MITPYSRHHHGRVDFNSWGVLYLHVLITNNTPLPTEFQLSLPSTVIVFVLQKKLIIIWKTNFHNLSKHEEIIRWAFWFCRESLDIACDRDITYIYIIVRAQEARLALGCASSNSHASFLLSKLPLHASITRSTHAKLVGKSSELV